MNFFTKNSYLFLTIIILLCLSTNKSTAETDGYCLRIIDGDTLIVQIGNKNEMVRLIGVDTPEVKGPYTHAEYFGKEASIFTSSLVGGKTISLQFDNERRDKYDRLLAYVYLPDGIFLNKQLIEKGYATVYKFFNYSKKFEFLKIEKEAREKCVGIWKPKCKGIL